MCFVFGRFRSEGGGGFSEEIGGAEEEKEC